MSVFLSSFHLPFIDSFYTICHTKCKVIGHKFCIRFCPFLRRLQQVASSSGISYTVFKISCWIQNLKIKWQLQFIAMQKQNRQNFFPVWTLTREKTRWKLSCAFLWCPKSNTFILTNTVIATKSKTKQFENYLFIMQPLEIVKIFRKYTRCRNICHVCWHNDC